MNRLRLVFVVLSCSALALLSAGCGASVNSGAASLESLGVVFVNGLGSEAHQVYDTDPLPAESSGGSLWYFYGLTRGAGYRSFMIASTKDGANSNRGALCLDSGGGIAENGMILREFLHGLQAEGITHVVLVGHSMGGLVCRSFIEQLYEPDDGYTPKVVELITLDTPHTGFMPGPNSVTETVTGLLQVFTPSVARGVAARQMTAENMVSFNKNAGNNPQVEYWLVGGEWEPIAGVVQALKALGYKGAMEMQSLWNVVPSDGLVCQASSLGYTISTTTLSAKRGPSLFGSDRRVARLPMVGYIHSEPDHALSRALLKALGLAADNVITLSDQVFQQCLAPGLKRGAELAGVASPGSTTP